MTSPCGELAVKVSTLERVLIGQGTIFVAGALLLWQVATPVYFDDASGLQSIDWPLLWVPALVFAGLSGTLAGLSIRMGWPWWIAALAICLVGLPAFYLPFFFVGDVPGSTVPDTNFTDLVAALLGWTLFNLASAGLAVAVSTLGRKQGGGRAVSHMDPGA